MWRSYASLVSMPPSSNPACQPDETVAWLPAESEDITQAPLPDGLSFLTDTSWLVFSSL